MCRSYEEPAQLSPLSDNPRAAPCSESTGQTRKNVKTVGWSVGWSLGLVEKFNLGAKSAHFQVPKNSTLGAKPKKTETTL